MLIAEMLQRAGLAFMSAKGRHSRGGVRIDDVLCEIAEHAQAVDEWAKREGFPVVARVATAEELAEWKRWQE